MSTQNNLTDFLTAVADSIRDKKGTTALIDPQNFMSEIASIPSGSDPVEIDISQTNVFALTVLCPTAIDITLGV